MRSFNRLAVLAVCAGGASAQDDAMGDMGGMMGGGGMDDMGGMGGAHCV